MRDASIVVAVAISPSARRRLIIKLAPLEISNDSSPTTSSGIPAAVVTSSALVIWTEPVMNGPATDKLQRSPIAAISRSRPAIRFRGTGLRQQLVGRIGAHR